MGLEGMEGLLLLVHPVPQSCLLCEIQEQLCDGQVVLNEVLVICYDPGLPTPSFFLISSTISPSYMPPPLPPVPSLISSNIPLGFPLYISLMTPLFASFQVVPFPFTFPGLPALASSFSEVIPPLPTVWDVSFHPSSRTIDFLANQRMPAPL